MHLELYSHFNELRLHEEFCDIVIKVRNRCFPCHRVILASATKYFRGMFSGRFREIGKREVELKGFANANDFELVLAHIYGAHVNLSRENVFRMLKISHYINLPSLEILCLDYVLSLDRRSFDTIIRVFLYECKMKRTLRTDGLRKRLAENFDIVSRDKNLLRITGTELKKLLSSQYLVTNGGIVLNFLIDWMKLQSDENRKLLPELLKEVELSMELSNEWFVRIINECVAPQSTTEGTNATPDDAMCVEEIDEYAEERLFFDTDEFPVVSQKPNEQELTLILLITTGDEYDVAIDRYTLDTISNTICYLDTIIDLNMGDIDHVLSCKSVFVENVHFMMLVDSEDKFRPTSIRITPYIFRDSEKEFLKTSNYSIENQAGVDAPYSASITACGTNIYFYNVGIFRAYNCECNNWTDMPNTNDRGFIQTTYPNLLSHGDNLYVIGGKTKLGIDEDNGKFFQQYDLRQGKWLQLPCMPHSHSRSASCIHNDTLYVTGGEDLTYYKGYVDCYDFKAGKWRVLESLMPKPKKDHIVLEYNNQLGFFGGHKYNAEDEELKLNLMWYSYDLEQCTWSDVYDNTFDRPTEFAEGTTRYLDVFK